MIRREGPRPRTSTAGPQTQLDQLSSAAWWDSLSVMVFAEPHVVESPSAVSPATSRAVLFDDLSAVAVAESSLAPNGPLEPVHLHGGRDTSLHLCLPRDDAAEAIDAGWAELHQYGDFGTELMVYGPRNAVELDVVIGLIRASIRFARRVNMPR